ncbi:MAG TPA: cytochrome c3 family protein [Planctomycetota bacterium]|nr:cytochrome c3 family protein [Planctomycetota bacterium]
MQVFHPSMNTIAKASIVAGVLSLALLVYAGVLVDRSPYVTRVNVPIDQPVQFSHEHHVGGLGIDCRYCHTSVEKSAFAGLPATQVCMSCHSQIWTGSHMLQPVRESYSSGNPIQWNRVHDLPDFAYFNHSVHVQKGIGCSSCHGNVAEMPLTWKVHSLRMEWCLNCHRQPEMYLRPKEEIFNPVYKAPANQRELGMKLKADYHIREFGLTNCSVCHK